MVRKIAISTNKGGVLKTSITVNLAGILSKEKKKILIVDMDDQGNVLLSFGKNPDKVKHSTYDVLVHGFPTKKAIVNVYKNIDVLPSNDDMTYFELDVLTNMKKYPNIFRLLANRIKEIEHLYDYILIDTPPSSGLTIGNAFTATDEVLIPFQPENYSMRSLVKILNIIKSFKEEQNADLEVLGVIATLVDQRTVLHSDVIQECRRYCLENGVKMFETVIPRAIRYANSIAYEGLPATLTEKNNELIQSYIDLKNEIEGEL